MPFRLPSVFTYVLTSINNKSIVNHFKRGNYAYIDNYVYCLFFNFSIPCWSITYYWRLAPLFDLFKITALWNK